MGHFGNIPNTKRAIDIAKWYWEEHGLVVIPAKLGEKHPIIPWADISSWEDASSIWILNEEDKEDDSLDWNYACLTGPSGVTVIDYDNKETIPASIDTFSVDTPRGRHQYLRVEGMEVGNSVNSDLKIDVRGQGGISILPPSHGASGTLYRLSKNAPIKVVDAQDWERICSVLELTSSDKRDRPKNEVGWFASTFYKPIGEGERNNTCAKLAGFLVGKGLTQGETEAILKGWNIMSVDPMMEALELERTVQSIYNKHEREKERGNIRTEDSSLLNWGTELADARARPDNRFA